MTRYSCARAGFCTYTDMSEDFDQREPVEPPAALMRKRKHVALWILLALGLGGLIALMMVAMNN
jgi:hypothetical protein